MNLLAIVRHFTTAISKCMKYANEQRLLSGFVKDVAVIGPHDKVTIKAGY